MELTASASKALQAKYELPQDAVNDAVSVAISTTLSKALKTKVLVQETENDIEFYTMRCGQHENDPVVHITQNGLTKKLMRHLRYNIEKELHLRKVISDHEKYRSLQSQLAWGSIAGISADGTLKISIDIEKQFGRDELFATCPLRLQPPHERGRYRIDEGKYFLVSSVRPVFVRGIPRLEILVGRTSPKLVERLLNKKISQKSIGLSSEINPLSCKKRIAGAYSEVHASQRIDKEIIKWVSRELREQLIVKFERK